MIDISTKFEIILSKENLSLELENYVYELSKKGFSRQNIYEAFLQYRNNIINSIDWEILESKNKGDHPLDLILDRLSGWCAKEFILLPNEPFKNK